MSQDDADRMAERQDQERISAKFREIYGDLETLINKFNENSMHERIEIDYRNNKFYYNIDIFELLYQIGITDEWMQMPDGSDAFSDFGIKPLEEILAEYDEDLPPEKVLVLVNRALDVYHQRGDMASIFVQGGTKALSRIAEEINRNSKKIYITEKQILKLQDGKHNR